MDINETKTSSIALKNFVKLSDRIEKLRLISRPTIPLKLICVSKTIAVDKIIPLIDKGHTEFGENKIQEAVNKYDSNIRSKINLHLLGPLQSNKLKLVAENFSHFHALDREKIAKMFADLQASNKSIPKLFVQINIGEEEQKSGVAPKNCASFIKYCRKIDLKIEGLMCIPPVDKIAAPYFSYLAALARENGVKELSMGMSGDWQQAVELGATYLRIGTAIFGKRQ